MPRKTAIGKTSKEQAHIMNQQEIKRAKNFEEATDAYKSIFTNNGLNLEGLVKLVENCLNLCEDSEKSALAHRLCFQAVIYGSFNYYEAIGILEAVKDDYRESWHDAMDD
jgi:hypothetical protein